MGGLIKGVIAQIQSWFSIYNVRYYGADKTGAANSTTAINNAIQAAVSAGGGKVKFPQGTYLVDSINIPMGAPVELVGDGWSYDDGAATKLISNSAVSMFIPANGANGITIRDMQLEGNNVGTYGWYGQYGNKARFENLFVENFTNTGIYSTEGLLVVRDSYILKCAQYGLDLNSDSWVYGNEVATCGVGIRIREGGVRCFDNLVNSCTSYGILLDGTANTSGTTGWNEISGGYIGENTGANIRVVGDSTARNARYNQIHDTFIQQVSTTGAAGIQIVDADFTQVSDVIFLGGSGGNNADTGGIVNTSSHNTQITGFTAYESTGVPLAITGSNDVTVNGIASTAHGSSVAQEYGITIDANSYRNDFNGVHLVDTRNPGYGKGISNAGVGTSIVNYRLSTPIGGADSLGTAAVSTISVNTGKMVQLGAANVQSNVAVAQGAVNLAVTLNDGYVDNNFAVSVTPSWNTTWWVTNKTTYTFTLNFGTAAPANATVDIFATH